MFRDWLLSGRWFTPTQFASDYYNHYPFFAVGYWPPAFYILTGLTLLLTGVGRLQALLVPAGCAAMMAWLLFHLLRPRTGPLLAILAGIVYLSLPDVQASLAMVMVDQMTACLCLAAAVCLLNYLSQPDYRHGILLALVCAFAILSKYSAAYLVVLPWAAILLYRRFSLLLKLSLYLETAIIALIVGPWVLWTARLAFIGLLPGRPAMTVARAMAVAQHVFGVFPPVERAIVVLGLLALLVLPRTWREDCGVLLLVAIGHSAFIFVSPVDAESRYFLAPAAAILVLALAGWAAAFERISARQRQFHAAPIFAAVLMLLSILAFYRSYPRPRQYPIGTIVETVLNNHQWAGRRVVLPSDLEGPFVAEFVIRDRHRPTAYLVRPSRKLATSTWFGARYTPFFRTPHEMLEYFRRKPVTLVIWHARPESKQLPHERVLGEMLRENPLVWRKVWELGTGPTSSWTIYEYVPPIPVSAGPRTEPLQHETEKCRQQTQSRQVLGRQVFSFHKFLVDSAC